jgi:hypothetical protein
MKRHAILAGLAGAMLIAGSAGTALAQATAGAKYYPDGTNCSLLNDAELVACQNQIYARQLQSGESAAATGPGDQTVIPGSNPAASAESASTIVLGAETNPPPARPEGTIGGADGGGADGGYATPQ